MAKDLDNKLGKFVDKWLTPCLCVAVVVLLAIVGKQCGCTTDKPIPPKGVVDTLRVVTYDTISVIKPIAKDSVVVRYVVERLPIATTDFLSKKDFIDSQQDGDKPAMAENKPAMVDGKPAMADSVAVVIPITQKVYGDSTYTAWVSGYKPSLDSLQVYPKTITEVVTIHAVEKPKRWGISLQAGYGATKQGMSPYFGVGLSYDLISF